MKPKFTMVWNTNLEELEERILEYLEEGYALHGSMFHTTNLRDSGRESSVTVQCMVLKENEDEEE